MVLGQQKLLRMNTQKELYSSQRKTASKMIEGVTVGELATLNAYIKSLEKQIEEIDAQIEATNGKINTQMQVVLRLKTEQASLEKLRDKQLDFYNKDAQKTEEKEIDEFVIGRINESMKTIS